MRAIVAVPFLDTEENGRAPTTRTVLEALRHDLDARHTIIPVDNGSTDLSTIEWVRDTFDEWIRFDLPRSVANGVNAAWYNHEGELLSGEAFAVKFDSDIMVCPPSKNWVENIIDMMLILPGVGLIGPRILNTPLLADARYQGVIEVRFLLGMVSARSLECFRRIGYCRHPGYVRWGWQDHWDSFRTKEAGLNMFVVPHVEAQELNVCSSLPKPYKDEQRAIGKRALVEWKQKVRQGERGIYERYVG